MNPLDLKGPEFLQLYLGLAFIAVVIVRILQNALRGPNEEPPPPALDLDPYEVAFLAGRESLAADAALAALVQKGALQVDIDTDRVSVKNGLPEGRVHPLERAIFQEASKPQIEQTINLFRKTVAEYARPLRHKLRRLNLVLDDDRENTVTWLPVFLAGALVLFGVMKMIVGISRGKPIGLLCILLVITFVAFGVVVTRAPHRTRMGDRAIRRLSETHEALRTTASSDKSALAANDLVLAVGLFGLTMLPEPLLLAIGPKVGPGGGGSSDSGCGSGCGSSCGGGCGGGCGGCGG